jgi:drug/metabolite transporter (DMT)-like permease
MKTAGELRAFSLTALRSLLRGAIRQPWLWLGVSLNALAFFFMLALFSRRDLSFVVPATASSYIFGALGSRYLLGERVTPLRWLGVLLVGIGVALTALG